MRVYETICGECLALYQDAKVLVDKGVLRVVEPPCDFCQDRKEGSREPGSGRLRRPGGGQPGRF